jgi:hypothetical protein
MRWVHVLLLTLIALLLPGMATAKVYRCQSANGSTVLTDQPKGKPGCVAIDTATPPLPGGFTPPVEPTAPAQIELPANPILPSISPAPMIPRQPGPGDLSLSPTGVKEAPEKTAPEAQRCSPRVNPLNPFAGMNCSPASGEPPTENKNQ